LECALCTSFNAVMAAHAGLGVALMLNLGEPVFPAEAADPA
jgi:hypothetical protein